MIGAAWGVRTGPRDGGLCSILWMRKWELWKATRRLILPRVSGKNAVGYERALLRKQAQGFVDMRPVVCLNYRNLFSLRCDRNLSYTVCLIRALACELSTA